MVEARTIRLEDVAYVNPRLSEKIDPSTLVSFVGMADLSADRAVTESDDARPYSDVAKGYTAFQDGDLLVAKITPCFENGKIGQARLSRRQGFGSTEFHVVRPHPEVADARFLLHFLRSPQFRAAGELRMTGSGGQRRVPVDYVNQAQLYLPPLDEQRRIAAILDKAEGLREKRREALAHLELLAQGVFHDVFGDPRPLRSKYQHALLGAVCSKVTDGTHHSPAIQKTGIPYITAKHLKSSGLEFFSNPWYVTETDHDAIYARCDPKRGDVLYIKDGATTGLAAVNDYDFPFSMLSSLALLRPGPGLTATYLVAWLNSPVVKRDLIREMAGAAITRFTLTKIKNFRIPLPPIEVQNEFGIRIGALELLKKRNRVQLAELDALCAALQQRAFKGEL